MESRDIPVSPESQSTFPFVEEALSRYQELSPDPVKQSRVVRKYMTRELIDGKISDTLTANPYQPGNKSYEHTTSFDKETYLKDRLRGKVLDIGSGGIPELDGIVPDTDVVYVDSHDQKQDNFRRVTVGDEPIPYPDGTFQSVYMRNVIQDVDQARSILPGTLRALAKDGKIVFEFQYMPEGVRTAVVATLTALSESGLDVTKACQVTLDETTIRHKEYKELEFNQPTFYLTVDLGEKQ